MIKKLNLPLFLTVLLILLVPGRNDPLALAQPAAVSNNRVRIYDSFSNQQGGDIVTAGPGRVVTSGNNIVVIDDGDERVRIYNLFGVQQDQDIQTNGRADVVPNGNLLAIIDNNSVKIYTLSGQQQGSPITTTSRANVVPMNNLFVVIEDSQVRIFGLFGSQSGSTITTNNRATVVPGPAGLAVVDDDRVRIFNQLGVLQGSAISTNDPTKVVANSHLFIVADDTGVKFYDVFGTQQGSTVSTSGQANVVLTTDRIIIADTAIRLYNGITGDPVATITTSGRGRAVASLTIIAVIDNNDRRVRFFDLSGASQSATVNTTSKVDVLVSVNERLVLVEDNQVRIYDTGGASQGSSIATNGRATVTFATDFVFIVDNNKVLVYDHFSQLHRNIPTVGRANVAANISGLGIRDDSRVRIYHHLNDILGPAINTTGQVSLATALDRIVILDGQDEAITGLAAGNDGPTVLGNPTTLTATITAGTNVTYHWDFGDGSSATGATVSRIYNQAGTFTATVTAQNSTGSASATTPVTISNVTLANDAQFIAQSVPPKLETGQTALVSITFKNIGTTTWTAGGGYKLGSQNPKDNTVWTGTARLPLGSSESVAPGQQKTFTFNITAPAAPGTYNFRWRMLQEGSAPEEFGPITPNVAITVTEPNPGSGPSLWELDPFDGLDTAPLDTQNGWHKARADRGSADVIDGSTPGDKILQIEAGSGETIVMDKDVPDQTNGRHILTFRVRATGATLPSLAKIELRTRPGTGWDKKFQLYFGSSMRVNYSPGGQAAVFIPESDLVLGQWYHLRVELDLDREQLDIYVDNNLAAAGIPMYPGPITELGLSGWDRPGLVELDNLVGTRTDNQSSPPPVLCNVLVASTFEVNDEGWLVVGDAQGNSVEPDYLSAGGNPGGHISATDDVLGGTWYWQAPAKFLGDLSAAYGGVLAFDLKQSGTSSQFNEADVILVSNTFERTLVFDTPYNPGLDWTPYRIPLNETAGWLDRGDDEAPTQDEMIDVLSTVSDLWIRGEFRSGPDTGGLDNVLLGHTACPDQLTDVYWTNPAGGSWSNPDNWSKGGAPGTGDHAIINLGGTYSVIVEGSQTAGSLSLGAANGLQTLVLRGNGATNANLAVTHNLLNRGVIRMESLDGSAAGLAVAGGSLTNQGVIAVEAGAGGSRTLQGIVLNHGLVDINHNLNFLGIFRNHNTLNLAAGRTLSIAGSTQAFNQNEGVLAGQGSVAMTAGSTFNFNGGAVTGAPVNLTGANLNFGPATNGAGQFVMNGAANHLNGNIAPAQSLSIRGTSAADTSVTAASGFNNAGTLEFDSAGGSKTAKLTITEGTLTNTGAINAAQGTGGNRIIEGDLFNDGFVTLSLGNGQAFIVNGSSFENGTAGIIKGVGQLNVASTGFINAGQIGPGFSPGILKLTGSYTQTPTGAFNVEIDRRLPAGTDFDRLLISGPAMLTGTLNISVTQTMAHPLHPGDRFQVLTCQPCSGVFAPVQGLEIGSGLRLEPIYNPTNLTLEVRPSLLEPITDTLYFPLISKG